VAESLSARRPRERTTRRAVEVEVEVEARAVRAPASYAHRVSSRPLGSIELPISRLRAGRACVRGLLVGLLSPLTLPFAAGCYLAHERPADAAVMTDAFALDAGSCLGWAPELPACGRDPQVVDVTESSCPRDRSHCVTIDVQGRDAVPHPEELCRGGYAGEGTRLLVRRCAPGSALTTVLVDAVQVPARALAGVFSMSDDGCTCSHVDRLAEGGGLLTGGGGATSDEHELDAYSFFGANTRYRVTICASPPICR
jgi:hypothetical protein